MSTQKRALPGQPLPEAANLIRLMRMSRGWSQEELAGRIVWEGKEGVSRQTIARWETEERDLTISKLQAVAAAFGVALRDMLPGEDEFPVPTPEERELIAWNRAKPLTTEERLLIEWWREAPARDRTVVATLSERETAAFIPDTRGPKKTKAGR